MTRTVAEVAGDHAYALRDKARKSLEDVATAARSYGLRWSTGSVSDFEKGRAKASLKTLLVVAAALGDVIGRPLTLAELFAGDGDVALNDGLTVPLATVRAALSGGVVSIPAPGTCFPVVSTDNVGITDSATFVRSSVRGGPFRETDERVCRALGVDPDVGARAMDKLWRNTFTAQRDLQAGSDANPQKRGRVSRQLKAKLREELSRGDY